MTDRDLERLKNLFDVENHDGMCKMHPDGGTFCPGRESEGILVWEEDINPFEEG